MYDAIVGLGSGATDNRAREASAETPTLGQIRKSIRPDGIVSFIDGRTYKTLKRHLTAHDLDPRSYRERYGLPADYPMVALSYSERRSALAKSISLGVLGMRGVQRRTGTDD